MADMVGTTIETCIRVMSRWSKLGWVRSNDEGFSLLDQQALERLTSS